MNLISEIISKKVLNLYSGKIEGVIVDAFFDDKYKKIKYFKMFDETDEEYEILSTKIYAISDSIVIRNSQAIIPIINQIEINSNNPLNLDVYSITGNYLGKLTDIELDEKLNTKLFKTTISSFSPNQIVNVKESIIVNRTDKQVSISNFKPKTNILNTPIPPTSNEKVTIMAPQIESIVDEKNQTQTNNSNFKIDSTPAPQKVFGNTDFLLGRKSLKTIYSLNNDLLIKQDTIITKKHVELAKRFGKLAELTIYSKRN